MRALELAKPKPTVHEVPEDHTLVCNNNYRYCHSDRLVGLEVHIIISDIMIIVPFTNSIPRQGPSITSQKSFWL